MSLLEARGIVVARGGRRILHGVDSLPATALTGATFLILCDLAARIIHPPVEIRLGVVTALLGGPIFIALLLRRYREVSAT